MKKEKDECINMLEKHKKALDIMATKEFTTELIALLRSRTSLIYLTCNEERRMLTYFEHLSASRGYTTSVWDCYRGLYDLISDEQAVSTVSDIKEPEVILDKIIEVAMLSKESAKSMKADGVSGIIYILLDFHRFIEDADAGIERRLKTISQLPSVVSVIVTGPNYVSTPSLENEFSLIDFPYPNNEEISIELDTIVQRVSIKQGKMPYLKKKLEENRSEIIQSVSGLTCKDAQKAFCKSLVNYSDFDIPYILKEKQQIIRKHGVLEFFEPKVTMDDIGGLGEMVNWLKLRKNDFTQDARDFNIPTPKGLLVLGFPGVGKSLTAKATSSLFGLPLLRLDFGKLFSSFVGSSEETTRIAIKLAEQVSPSILWIDEVEKGLSGSKSSGQTDGGTTARVVGTFLTWMEEKEASVFMFCTANDHSQIPPEFMRRFDEVFFVDLPTLEERSQIYEVLLRKYDRDYEKYKIDLLTLAQKSENYSGSEIEKSIVESLHACYNEGKRDLSTKDILNSLDNFNPLFKIREAEFSDMRAWAKETCRLANSANKKLKIASNKQYENIDL